MSSGSASGWLGETESASCQARAGEMSRASGSAPTPMACSATSRPAYAAYVGTGGSPASSRAGWGGGGGGGGGGAAAGAAREGEPPLREPPPDAAAQFRGGLAGERQPQH